MSKALIAVVVIIAIVLLVVLFVFGQYVSVKNTLVSKNEAVKASWSQVDIVLQRRADLIPNLVETVKGYAQQEVTVFGDIAKARSALLSAGSPQEKIAANGQLDGTRIFCACRTNSPAPKIALPLSASATTTPFAITTLTCSNFPIASSRESQALNRMRRISRRRQRRAKFRR